jgi:hypothetical protein
MIAARDGSGNSKCRKQNAKLQLRIQNGTVKTECNALRTFSILNFALSTMNFAVTASGGHRRVAVSFR